MLRAVGSSDNSAGGKTRRSGRGAGQGRGNTTGGTDPYFAQVVSLNHFDGVNGATTYTDVIAGRTWTNAGGANPSPNRSELSTTNPKFGTASMGASNSYAVGLNDEAAVRLGSGDFTVEFWFYSPSTSSVNAQNITLFMKGSDVDYGSIYIVANTNGSLGAYIANATNNGWAANSLGAAGQWTINTWYHVALSRTGNNGYLFLNGVQQGTTMNLTGVSILDRVGVAWGVGGNSGSSAYTLATGGKIDEFRMTKGVGRYTANFTPPTSAFPNS